MKVANVRAPNSFFAYLMKHGIASASLAALQLFVPLLASSADLRHDPFAELPLSVSPRGACARVFRVVGAVSSPDGAVQISLKQKRSIRDARVCELLVSSKEKPDSEITVDAPGARAPVTRFAGPGHHVVRLHFPRRLMSGNRGYSIRVVSVPFDQFIEEAPLVASLLPVSSGSEECSSALNMLREEEIQQRSCVANADCGSSSIPFGCGCQFAKPMRRGGDAGSFSRLLDDAQLSGCEVGDSTICSCADIEGVVCRRGICDWQLSSGSEGTEVVR
jgi:hypothetical protein